MKKSLNLSLTLVFIVTIILTGCTSGNSVKTDSKVLKEMGKDEKAAIKVLYYNENSFLREYGNLFAAKFPNIEVKVVSTQAMYQPGINNDQEQLDKLIGEEKPDVLLLRMDQYEKMAADGKLLELDSVIKKDKFDIENILPAVMDLIKSKGNGKLYGLAPSFNSNALFYNKDMFDQYGVPYPKDQMSWDEVLQLAKRFPTHGDEDKRIYGYYMNAFLNNSIFRLAYTLAHTEGKSYIDADGLKITIDDEDWRRIFQSSIDLLKANVMNQPKTITSGDSSKLDLFAQGRAAMTVSDYYSINTMNQVKQQSKDFKPFNWDLVTIPVDPKYPNVSSDFGIGQVFAVNAQSTAQRASWELVKYLNSDELVKIQSRTTLNLPSRTSYLKEIDGHSLEAFYKLKLRTNTPNKGLQNEPAGFFQIFNKLAANEMQPVIDGKKTLDEAIKSLQAKGQQALDQAAADAKAKKD